MPPASEPQVWGQNRPGRVSCRGIQKRLFARDVSTTLPRRRPTTLTVCSVNPTRTHSTVMCASLLQLPFDVLEHIIQTLDRQDLLALALSCSTWKDIIIPRHIQYREISLSVDHHWIWKHLSERPSLAANVRRLAISDAEWYQPGLSFPLIGGLRWHIPTTLVNPWSDIPISRMQQPGYPLLALRNMRLLKTLEFDNISRWSLGSPDTLSQFLANVPNVENLILRSSRSRGLDVDGRFDGDQVSTSAVFQRHPADMLASRFGTFPISSRPCLPACLGIENTFVPFILPCYPAWTCRSVFVPHAFEVVVSARFQ